ncbi:sigma-54 dependent transcriptional regulator [uncultured Azohydromonas sp.]|jgi:Response regulator containing CheY-like receiver, AAA-type ATPase, and DNA-binding domains|uniref:sigma-54-dependent transcriptional regulator n=1 Tax=uncultured Azohydromonas sp. TaxID=487342 RepID=UPI0026185660|nr:sigma-54 dependent transcriptional regulator [uncultured Azohydromonas sp.]
MNAREAIPVPASAQSVRVLVIDDDVGVGEVVSLLLGRVGHDCVVCDSARAGVARLREEDFDLVITDLRMPDGSGLQVVAAARQHLPDAAVILMTSYSSIESAIEALRRGANDYIIKPFDNDDFLFSIERVLEERRLRRENRVLRRSLRKAYGTNTLIGRSPGVQRLQALIQRVAHTDANVLIQGESGTGKELVAQAIHFSGDRAHKPFVPVNCGAIPSDLIESELFGHAKGAFTGASSASEGLIREASGGTLFLDEISELPLGVQVKLLRVLQERQVRPVGSTQAYHTDTRFLAATNRDLRSCAEQGTFRADLYYRLNVITIHVPPLRERTGDIELLAVHFMREFVRKFNSPITGMAPEFLGFLNNYHWPGNVRELQNVIERAVILADTELLSLGDLEESIATPAAARVEPEGDVPLSIEDYIKDVVLRYQDRCNEAQLAQMLGIGRKALWMRRKQWGLFRAAREAVASGGRP